MKYAVVEDGKEKSIWFQWKVMKRNLEEANRQTLDLVQSLIINSLKANLRHSLTYPTQCVDFPNAYDQHIYVTMLGMEVGRGLLAEKLEIMMH